jgi:hypothetical protein
MERGVVRQISPPHLLAGVAIDEAFDPPVVRTAIFA